MSLIESLDHPQRYEDAQRIGIMLRCVSSIRHCYSASTLSFYALEVAEEALNMAQCSVTTETDGHKPIILIEMITKIMNAKRLSL